MPSIIEARFNTRARVMPGAQAMSQITANATTGKYITVQDPDTGAITQKWDADIVDNPSTPEVTGYAFDIVCEFRGIIAAGTRGAAATETYGPEYLDMHIVKMRFPNRFHITNADRVTAVRAMDNTSLWLDNDGKDIVWDVRGVTPIFDPFGRKTDNYALLERVQNK